MTDLEIINQYLVDDDLKKFIGSSLMQSLLDIGLPENFVNDLVGSLHTCNFSEFSERYKNILYKAYTIRFLHDLAGKMFVNEVLPNIQPVKTILDLGCGTGTLVELLLASKRFEEVRGIDIHKYPEWIDEKLSAAVFEVVKEADVTLYLVKLKPDAIVLTWTLHHMNYDEQARYAKMIADSLQPGAQIVFLEDSYSETLRPKYGQALHDVFMFWPIEKRQQIMAVQDWLANRILAQRDAVPMPFGYRTLEGWKELFLSVGFSVMHESYIGFPHDRDINNPQSLLVLEVGSSRSAIGSNT